MTITRHRTSLLEKEFEEVFNVVFEFSIGLEELELHMSVQTMSRHAEQEELPTTKEQNTPAELNHVTLVARATDSDTHSREEALTHTAPSRELLAETSLLVLLASWFPARLRAFLRDAFSFSTNLSSWQQWAWYWKEIAFSKGKVLFPFVKKLNFFRFLQPLRSRVPTVCRNCV